MKSDNMKKYFCGFDLKKPKCLIYFCCYFTFYVVSKVNEYNRRDKARGA